MYVKCVQLNKNSSKTENVFINPSLYLMPFIFQLKINFILHNFQVWNYHPLFSTFIFVFAILMCGSEGCIILYKKWRIQLFTLLSSSVAPPDLSEASLSSEVYPVGPENILRESSTHHVRKQVRIASNKPFSIYKLSTCLH